jgi:hypothetical protein
LSREFVPGLRVRKVARVAVLSVEVWERVVRQPGRLILLPLFDDPDVTAALEHNHHVVVPVDRDDVVRGNSIDLRAYTGQNGITATAR